MTVNPEQVGIVVVMEKTVVSGLAKLAERHRWPLIHLSQATQVMRKLGREQVDIAVVHIAFDFEQSVDLISWLRTTRKEILLIAVASTHRDEAEAAARHAGAHCYLPQSDEVSLERAINELIEQRAERLQELRLNEHADASRRRNVAASPVARRRA